MADLRERPIVRAELYRDRPAALEAAQLQDQAPEDGFTA